MTNNKIMTEEEFTLTVVRRFPSVTASPMGHPEQATRDLTKIAAWIDAGEELMLYGIGLKKGV